jgi:hypothetical protein
MMILLVCLMALNLVALPLIAWWAVYVNRRQRDSDLRYHRSLLSAHIHNELTLQDSRLADRFRP